MTNGLDEKKKYLIGLVDAIINMQETPFPFLCVAAMIEYISKLAQYGEDTVEFIKHEFPPKYRNFKYQNGQADLAYQMKSVLRDGLIHNFSFTPAKSNGSAARRRSILITHRSNKDGEHLTNVSAIDGQHIVDGEEVDAALLVLEDFCEDVKKAIEKTFNKAQTDDRKRKQLEARWKKFPPINWLGRPS
jgi:hypothetical protein